MFINSASTGGGGPALNNCITNKGEPDCLGKGNDFIN